MKNLKENLGAGNAGEVKLADPIFEKFGLPFVDDARGNPILNQAAVAAMCARELRLEFEPAQKRYLQYQPKLGLWLPIHEVDVRRHLLQMLLTLGAKFGCESVVQRATNSAHRSLSLLLQHAHAILEAEQTTGLVHVKNGVLDLQGDEPVLRDHDAKFRFFASSGIYFDKNAKCPRFEEALLAAALSSEDIKLFQKYCGSALIGPNLAQGLMLLLGTSGGGKTTLLTIVERILGEHLVAHLRTNHLEGRFESSAFIGKKLLVGKDVARDTLAQKGARLLKSLVGGDLLQAEAKYSPTKHLMRGDFHVIIVSNSRLSIALDGDAEAWRRRLLVLNFDKPKPPAPITNFAEVILADEASGVLNWLAAGALAFRSEVQLHGRLALSELQQARVDSLLQDSDNVLGCVKKILAADKMGTVSSEELVVAYHDYCESAELTPVSTHAFQQRVADVMLKLHRSPRRNDILRNSRAVRGWKGVKIA